MNDKTADPQIVAALYEFQQYLADKVPPLTVADSIELLLHNDPRVLASEIQSWTAAQFRGKGPAFPIADYLFHSLKKIHLIGELRLIEPKSVALFLERLKPLVSDVCPAEDREQFLKSLELMETESASGNIDALAENIYHTGSSRISQATAAPVTEEAAQSLRRFSLLLERLHTTSDQPSPESNSDAIRSLEVDAIETREQIAAKMITTAAATSTTSAELNSFLEQIRRAGIDTAPGKVFRALGESLPPWPVPQLSEEDRSRFPPSFGAGSPVDAMHKLVTMADTPREGAKRFYEMVVAAIDQFNRGSLNRAVTMFDLAERIITEKQIEDSEVRTVRSTLVDSLDEDQLRKYTENRDKHPMARRVLSFFPSMSAAALLQELEDEDRRDRRRWLLALLEVHGATARDLALELAERLARLPDADPFYLRNVLYLVNRIPRLERDALDKEVDLFAGLTMPQVTPIVAKEALAGLANARGERAEKALISRLASYESMLLRPESSRCDPQDARQLLDRCIATLSRFPSNTALMAVLDHGLRNDPALGDTRARLANLSGIDLTEFDQVVERLITVVRAELPRKVLGFIVKKRQTPLVRLIEALSGTPSAPVRTLFEDIVERFPEQDFTKAVSQALTVFGAAPRATSTATPSLSGDLEVFGLPGLLQTLAEQSVSGALSIYDEEGVLASSISLESGAIVRCHYKQIYGREAIFQLFEQTSTGTFAFHASREPIAEIEGGEPPIQISPLIFEAVIRYEELARHKLIVPVYSTLTATGAKPQPHPDETDAKLVRDVWLHASSGAHPSEWERELGVSGFRIWRLLSHWVETGALQLNAA